MQREGSLLFQLYEAEINVGEVVVAVEEVAHIICGFLTKERVETLNTQMPRLPQPQLLQPPLGYVQPPHSSHFSWVLQGHLILLCHRRPNRWIYYTGCTAHSAYLRETFHSLVAHDEPMYAANGTHMTIGGLGTAGPFSDVLFLPDLRVNLFSQTQAMRDGSRITLSPDAQILTVVLPPNRTLKFIFGGSGTTTRNSCALLRWSNLLLLSVSRSLRTTSIIGRWLPPFRILVPSKIPDASLSIRPLELYGHAASTAGSYLNRFPAQSPKYPPGAAAAMPCVPPDEEQASVYLECRPLCPASPRPAVPHGPQDGEDAFNQPRALHRRHHRRRGSTAYARSPTPSPWLCKYS
jgi:hypothetical protein